MVNELNLAKNGQNEEVSDLKAKLESLTLEKIESERQKMDIIGQLNIEIETIKTNSKKLESINKHLLAEKDEQEELVEFVQMEKEAFAKDLETLKVKKISLVLFF